MGHLNFRLQEAELEDLLAQAQADPNDNSGPMNEVVRRFDPLAINIGRRLTGDTDLQAVLANSARIELVKVCRRHHVGTPGFGAYAKLSMNYAAQRDWKRTRCVSSREEAVDPTESDSECALVEASGARPTTWTEVHVLKIISTLTPAQRALLDQRYLDELTLEKIGADRGTSASAVHQRLETVHSVFRRSLAA